MYILLFMEYSRLTVNVNFLIVFPLSDILSSLVNAPNRLYLTVREHFSDKKQLGKHLKEMVIAQTN